MDASAKPGPGAPRHPATEQAKTLLAAGHSLRRTAALLKEEGHTISITTLSRIRSGRPRRAESLLAARERRLASPVTCPTCRDPIDVVPCRVCGAEWPSELDDLNRAHDRRLLALSQQRPGS